MTGLEGTSNDVQQHRGAPRYHTGGISAVAYRVANALFAFGMALERVVEWAARPLYRAASILGVWADRREIAARSAAIRAGRTVVFTSPALTAQQMGEVFAAAGWCFELNASPLSFLDTVQPSVADELAARRLVAELSGVEPEETVAPARGSVCELEGDGYVTMYPPTGGKP